MHLGSVIVIDQRHFVLLARNKSGCAIAPMVSPREKSRSFDVKALGQIVRCSATRIVAALPDQPVDITLSAQTLADCQSAAAKAAWERSLTRFAPLALFDAAMPRFRSGGRQIGAKAGA